MSGRFSKKIQDFIKKQVYFYKDKSKLGLSKSDYFKLLRYRADYTQPMSIEFNGNKTHFSSPFWFLHSIEEIFIDEVYKFSPLRKDALILDCGANIGLSVLYFKQICPAAKIIAFEADPFVFELLEKNIKESALSDVDLLNKAVWTEDTVLEFDAEGGLGGRLGLGEVEIKNKIDVKTIRLRDYLDQKVDFLKIDIEGAEYNVLKDCVDKLHNVENLFLEYHILPTEEQNLDEILLWLRNAGFRYYIKEAWENQKYPFVSKKGTVYEMQLNISCYRH
jgi:FkbM family methyltransferase